MASLYPSLEDMKVDQIQKAQFNAAQNAAQSNTANAYPQVENDYTGGQKGQDITDLTAVYPSLMQEYMGLKLEPPTGPLHPSYPTLQTVAQIPNAQVAIPANHMGATTVIAPLSGNSVGMARANVTHAIREVVVCKDGKGKVGMRLREQSKGVFVQCVIKGSPAALAGVRFGDQILQIDGKNLAGLSGDKCMNILKKASAQRIVLAVRDRPYERTITLHKDSSGHVGFVYRDTEIVSLAKDSSAARNGLLIDHNILEVNGQNVVGMKSKDMDKLFQESTQVVTLTIMPNLLYKHMVHCLADDLLKKKMDHGIPDVC